MIPQQALPAFEYTVDLDGKQFQLDFEWNSRFKFWTLSVSDDAGTPVYLGLKLALDYPLWLDTAVDGLPTPSVIMMDSTGKATRVERNDLGNEVQLYVI